MYPKPLRHRSGILMASRKRWLIMILFRFLMQSPCFLKPWTYGLSIQHLSSYSNGTGPLHQWKLFEWAQAPWGKCWKCTAATGVWFGLSLERQPITDWAAVQCHCHYWKQHWSLVCMMNDAYIGCNIGCRCVHNSIIIWCSYESDNLNMYTLEG